MPKRATRLLDEHIVPTRKHNADGSLRRFRADFLLFINGNTTPQHEEKTILAPNQPAAVKIARGLCENPTVFPAGCVARIPERNVIPVEDDVKIRLYQAHFEIYRLGDRKRRPHIVLRNIEANSKAEAVKTARAMCQLPFPGACASDLVRCPAANVKPL